LGVQVCSATCNLCFGYTYNCQYVVVSGPKG
ncbi:hypothetical protein A2U01_0072267, partial [Trifolium medium]|nr:hypothetical protein [Trifolium medium]